MSLDPAALFGLGWPVLTGLFAVVMLATAFQSASGVGFGLLVAPVMAIADPGLIPATVLLIGMFAACSAAWRHRANIRWRQVAWPIGARLPGVVAGSWLLVLFADEKAIISVVFGFVVLIAVWLTLSRFRVEPRPLTLSLAGFLSGLMGTLTGIGGPPMGIVYQHGEPAEVRAAMNAFFAFGTLMTVAALLLTHLIEARHVRVAALLLPAVPLGLYGANLLSRASDRYIRTILMGFCALSGLILIIKGLT